MEDRQADPWLTGRGFAVSIARCLGGLSPQQPATIFVPSSQRTSSGHHSSPPWTWPPPQPASKEPAATAGERTPGRCGATTGRAVAGRVWLVATRGDAALPSSELPRRRRSSMLRRRSPALSRQPSLAAPRRAGTAAQPLPREQATGCTGLLRRRRLASRRAAARGLPCQCWQARKTRHAAG